MIGGISPHLSPYGRYSYPIITMVKMVWKIIYNTTDNTVRAKLNYTLFGRIRKCKVKGKYYYHYYAGALDKVKFKRVGKAKILIVEVLPDYVLAEVKDMLPSVKVIANSSILEDGTYTTAHEHWSKNPNYKLCRNLKTYLNPVL